MSPETLSIVPQPPPPGIYITIGPGDLTEWALENITRSFPLPNRVIWMDAANAFNAYVVAITARAAGKDATLILKSFQVARPFTAFQLETMVSDKSLPIVRRFGALFSVIADPLRLFRDAEGRDTQIHQCFDRFIAGLQRLAKESAVLVLHPSHANRYAPALIERATRITHLKRIENRLTLSLVSPQEALALG